MWCMIGIDWLYNLLVDLLVVIVVLFGFSLVSICLL